MNGLAALAAKESAITAGFWARLGRSRTAQDYPPAAAFRDLFADESAEVVVPMTGQLRVDVGYEAMRRLAFRPPAARD
jgi:hypothetical protein